LEFEGVWCRGLKKKKKVNRLLGLTSKQKRGKLVEDARESQGGRGAHRSKKVREMFGTKERKTGVKTEHSRKCQGEGRVLPNCGRARWKCVRGTYKKVEKEEGWKIPQPEASRRSRGGAAAGKQGGKSSQWGRFKKGGSNHWETEEVFK